MPPSKRKRRNKALRIRVIGVRSCFETLPGSGVWVSRGSVRHLSLAALLRADYARGAGRKKLLGGSDECEDEDEDGRVLAHHHGHEDEPLWIQIENATPQQLHHIGRHFGLHPLTVEGISSKHTREKMEVFQNYLFLVFHSLKDSSSRATKPGQEFQAGVGVGDGDATIGPIEEGEEASHSRSMGMNMSMSTGPAMNIPGASPTGSRLSTNEGSALLSTSTLRETAMRYYGGAPSLMHNNMEDSTTGPIPPGSSVLQPPRRHRSTIAMQPLINGQQQDAPPVRPQALDINATVKAASSTATLPHTPKIKRAEPGFSSRAERANTPARNIPPPTLGLGNIQDTRSTPQPHYSGGAHDHDDEHDYSLQDEVQRLTPESGMTPLGSDVDPSSESASETSTESESSDTEDEDEEQQDVDDESDTEATDLPDGLEHATMDADERRRLRRQARLDRADEDHARSFIPSAPIWTNYFGVSNQTSQSADHLMMDREARENEIWARGTTGLSPAASSRMMSPATVGSYQTTSEMMDDTTSSQHLSSDRMTDEMEDTVDQDQAIFQPSCFVVNHVKRGEPIRTTAIKLVVFPHLVLSFHASNVGTVNLVRNRLSRVYGDSVESTAWVVHALLDGITDSLLPVVNATVTEVDALEELIYVLSGNEHRDLLKRMAMTRRKLSFLRHKLLTKKDILLSLIGKDWQLFLAGVQVPYLRDVYDHVVTMLHKVEAASDMLLSLQSTYLANVQIDVAEAGNDANDVMQNLTAVGAIMLPLQLVSGMWGMNCLVPWQFDEDVTFERLLPFLTIVLAMILIMIGMTTYFKKRGLL